MQFQAYAAGTATFAACKLIGGRQRIKPPHDAPSVSFEPPEFCGMNRIPPAARIVVVLLIGAAILSWVLIGADRRIDATKRIGFQGSAPPLGMPANGTPDHRFAFPSAWLRASIPIARRFDSPMGQLTYNAQAFWEMNEKRGGRHTGDDLNGIGGMNTDLGDPVYAVADGLVLYSGEPSPGWGKVVILAHRTVDGRLLQSMYAHLDRIQVTGGALAARGQTIGTVGTANDHYPAHLHFEMRESDHIDIGPGYVDSPHNSLDPLATLEQLRGAPDEDHSPSPLATILQHSDAGWTGIEIQGAEHLPPGFGGE